jgi:3-hydroxybutyrate dehydrogenase
MDLRGRVALVTGSTSGIGHGIAVALAEQGADIMVHGFGEAPAIAALRSELTARFGVRTGYSDADVSRPELVRAMVAQTEAALGPVDILVNNAGIQVTAPIDAFPDDKWDLIIAINLSSAFHAIKAVTPGMRQRGWGRIVNIASAHGLVASAQKVGYVAAKHGLLGITKVAALELANTGVTCNAICPGWVLTPLVQQQLDARAAREGLALDEVKHRLLTEKQPLADFTTPEQIGALTVFLCSAAARTMTGVPVSIDGGWTAQ